MTPGIGDFCRRFQIHQGGDDGPAGLEDYASQAEAEGKGSLWILEPEPGWYYEYKYVITAEGKHKIDETLNFTIFVIIMILNHSYIAKPLVQIHWL